MKKLQLIALILILWIGRGMAQPVYTTSIHPLAEILSEVVGERGEVNRLLPPGASPHTYELRPSDLRTVESSTAIFYGSEHLDQWVLRFPDQQKVELLTLLPSEYHQPALIKHHHTSDHHEEKTDPHFWTDPLTVKALLPPLVDQLCQIDPGGCDIYQTNAQQFAASLDSLHQETKKLMTSCKGKAVMMSHPFYQYFLKRYGILIAGVVESIPGKESTPKELQGMIKLAKEEDVKAILTLPQSPDRPAQIISESTGIDIYELDPIGGVDGVKTYFDMIRHNTKILIEALQ